MRVSNIFIRGIRVYTPGLQQFLGRKRQRGCRTSYQHIALIIEKSSQCQKNGRSDGSRETFSRKLLREFPIRIILGYGESHLQILIDKSIHRLIVSDAQVRLGKFQ